MLLHLPQVGSWIILGLVAGFIAARIVKYRDEGVILEILVGILGAVFATGVTGKLGMRAATGFNVFSIAVSAIGAVLILLVYNEIRRTV